MGESTTVKRLMGAVLEDGRWVMKEIDADFRSLQAHVGGLIELIPLVVESAENLVSVFGNDEARLLEMEPSACRMWDDGTIADVIVGPLVALGGVDKEGESLGITPEGFALLNRGMVPIVPAAGPARHSYDMEVRISSW